MTIHESDPLMPEKSEEQEDEEAEERFADESPAENPSPELSNQTTVRSSQRRDLEGQSRVAPSVGSSSEPLSQVGDIFTQSILGHRSSIEAQPRCFKSRTDRPKPRATVGIVLPAGGPRARVSRPLWNLGDGPTAIQATA